MILLLLHVNTHLNGGDMETPYLQQSIMILLTQSALKIVADFQKLSRSPLL